MTSKEQLTAVLIELRKVKDLTAEMGIEARVVMQALLMDAISGLIISGLTRDEVIAAAATEFDGFVEFDRGDAA